MSRIYQCELLVEQALIDNPETRGDNFILYIEVLRKFVDTKMSLEAIFLNHKALRIPSLETITRCRRKLQENDPSLRDEIAEKIRADEEEDFIEYSKE